MTWRVEEGDCAAVMATLDDESVHAVVCDPPYGLSAMPDAAEVLRHWLAGDDYQHRGGGFMGKSWDSFVPGPSVWREAFRVLKPGGHLLAFGGTRTADLLSVAIRLAGFELRDRVLTLAGQEVGLELDWLYGAGFPKSLDATRGMDPDDAERWQGWGTALKPAHEPVVVARKPFRGTVAGNVLAHGTGALNIDAGRVAMSDHDREVIDTMGGFGTVEGHVPNDVYGEYGASESAAHPGGRWPANVALVHLDGCQRTGTREVATGVSVRENIADEGASPGHIFDRRVQRGPNHGYGDDGSATETVEAWECAPGCPVAELDAQAGDLASGTPGHHRQGVNTSPAFGGESRQPGDPMSGYGDRGAASRFFYAGKASSAERDAGLADFTEREVHADWMPNNPKCRACGRDRIPREPGAQPCECTEPDWAPSRDQARANSHPTVKPIGVMRWLQRIVCPPGGIVLEPYAGSGSGGCAAVLEGFDYIGIEREPLYVRIARARIRWWDEQPEGLPVEDALRGDARRRKVADTGQLDLLD